MDIEQYFQVNVYITQFNGLQEIFQHPLSHNVSYQIILVQKIGRTCYLLTLQN